MPAARPFRPVPRRLAPVLVAVLASAAACSDDGGPAAGPGTEAPEPSDGAPGTPEGTGAGTGTATSVGGTTTTAGPTTSTSPSTSTTTSTTLPPTTTTEPIVTEGAIVLVANAAGVPGAAAALTAELAGLGFATREPTNAAGYEIELATTKVYARPGSGPAAASIARLLGGVPVSPLPTPVPIVDAMEGLGDATVVVMLGADLAGQPLPDPPAG